ncbi:MAG: class II fructose-bisphosphate aldolase [Actinobacteria bacterium]|nr:class II fructose-bisphosphate aldolase [Actinomycetota bacterium]
MKSSEMGSFHIIYCQVVVLFMSHVTLKEILADTRNKRYAIPCLAGINLEAITGIIKASEEKNSPVILCYNKQLTPDFPIEVMMPILVRAAESSKVPVATTLDHGSDFGLIMKSIHFGSSSVMFDGSGLPFDENVTKTREIVRVAHSLGVSVEAELGGVGGSAVEAVASSTNKSIFTEPSEARRFVDATGVDCLAVSFGNMHGRYSGQPNLDLDRVRKIASLVFVPLVMHGASGLNEFDYIKLIDAGISKLNYFSSMCRNIYSKLKNFMEVSKEDAFCINTIPVSVDFWYQESKKLLDICRCSGRAGVIYPGNFINIIAGIVSEEIMKNME